MTDETGSTPSHWTGGRVAAVVSGTVLALLALGLLGAGGVLLWGDGHKDDAGYLSTSSHHYGSSGYAVSTDDLDVDLGAPHWLVDHGHFGKVRVQASSRTDAPVFVGVARTADVRAYLAGSAHAVLTDVDYDPFDATYAARPGERRPAAPTRERFWAASAHGAGTRTMTWKVRDGNWSVVVMNADGSRGVNASVRVGASVPLLREAGVASLSGGVVLLVLGGILVAVGARAPRPRTPVAPRSEVAA